MLPERRCCDRHPIRVQIQIRYGRRRFYSAFGRNLSSAGMWVEVRSLTLPVGTLVELEFEAIGRRCLVSARVVHHDATGIGLAFAEPRPNLLADLVQVENLPPPPPQVARRSPPLQRPNH
jgi:hypothetical protein